MTLSSKTMSSSLAREKNMNASRPTSGSGAAAKILEHQSQIMAKLKKVIQVLVENLMMTILKLRLLLFYY